MFIGALAGFGRGLGYHSEMVHEEERGGDGCLIAVRYGISVLSMA
jgi:hypothetical protein